MFGCGMQTKLVTGIQLVESALWVGFGIWAIRLTVGFAVMYGWLPEDAEKVLLQHGGWVGEWRSPIRPSALVPLGLCALVAALAYGCGKLWRRIERERRS